MTFVPAGCNSSPFSVCERTFSYISYSSLRSYHHSHTRSEMSDSNDTSDGYTSTSYSNTDLETTDDEELKLAAAQSRGRRSSLNLGLPQDGSRFGSKKVRVCIFIRAPNRLQKPTPTHTHNSSANTFHNSPTTLPQFIPDRTIQTIILEPLDYRHVDDWYGAQPKYAITAIS